MRYANRLHPAPGMPLERDRVETQRCATCTRKFAYITPERPLCRDCEEKLKKPTDSKDSL